MYKKLKVALTLASLISSGTTVEARLSTSAVGQIGNDQMGREARATLLEFVDQYTVTVGVDATVENLAGLSAAKMVGILDISEAIPKLERALEFVPRSGQGEIVRLEIYASLVRLGKREYLDELQSEMLLNSGVERLEIARVLANLGDEAAIQPLRDAVRGRDTEARWYAVQALAARKDQLAKAYLTGGLTQPNEQIRLDCAFIMAKAGWGDGERLLENLLVSGTSEQSLGAAEGLAHLGSEAAKTYLIDALKAGSDEERSHALVPIGSLPIARARPVLEDIVSLDTATFIVVPALFALGNIGDHSSLESIRRLAESDDLLIRLAANAAIIQVLEGRRISTDEMQ